MYRKELLLVTGIFFTALAFFLCNYQYYPEPVSIKPGQIKCRPHNCFKKETNKIHGYYFSKGYAYLIKNQNLTSVYTDPHHNIAMVPTAPGWHVPAFKNTAQLFLQKDYSNLGLSFYCGNDFSDSARLPVVLLITDPNGFFNNDSGIYVQGNKKLLGSARNFYTKPWTEPANYFERGKDWKRAAIMVYYDKEGHYKHSAPVNLQITGNATRSFPQKSLRMDFDKKSRFAFFNDSISYSSIVLRNGGNDWGRTFISDGVMQESVASTGLDVLNFKPCIVYINGVYWGIHSLRNRSNRDFIAEKFGVKPKRITTMENWQMDKGDENVFAVLMDVVNQCKKPSGVGLIKKIGDLIDLDNFAFYLAAQFFFVNTDWPANNIKAYCIDQGKKPGKWRFVFFDLDYGMGYTGANAVKTDMFSYIKDQNNTMACLVKVLLQDKGFKKKLLAAFTTLLKDHLSAERLESRIRAYERQLEPFIPGQISRWRKPSGLKAWKGNVNSLVRFVHQRQVIIREQINKNLGMY